MSEPIAEAFVLIRPNLSVFNKELQAQLQASMRSGAATNVFKTATKQQGSLGSAIKGTTKTLQDQGRVAGQAARDIDRLSRGVAATALSQFGLRGATLAASGAFLVGAASVTALAKALKIATGFNSEIAVFGAVTGATGDELERVAAKAKELGASFEFPGVTATDAAVAMTELAKAGLSVEDSIAGVDGVLQLGQAANISFAQATELVASALNAFALSGREASTVADVLANAANAAQGSIVDIGIAFQQAAAIGHQVGLTFQDTTLFITELARAGLTGSDAGTSLRTALIRLINPSKKAAEVFQQLGIHIRDAQGNLRPDFFVNLGVALQGMGRRQRDATLALIGGQDAVRALAILSRGGIKELIKLRGELAKQGTAAEVAKARLTGLAGAGSALQNTIEGIALNLGQKATPALISFTNSIRGAIEGISTSPLTPLLGESLHGVAEGFRAIAQAGALVPPVLGPIIASFAAVAQALGPTAIVATAAAFILLRKAMSGGLIIGVGVGLTRIVEIAGELRLAIAADVAEFGRLAVARTLTASLGTSLLGLLTSTTAITLGIAVLAGGLFFLATRESGTERATRHLEEATKDLAKAFGDANDAADTLAHTQLQEKIDETAVQTAKLAAARAVAARAALGASATTLQLAEANNQVDISNQNVEQAEQRLRDTRKEVKKATDDEVAASSRLRTAFKQEIDVTNDLIKKQRERAAVAVGGISGIFGKDDPKAEALAIDETIKKIRERAKALKDSASEEERARGKQLEAFAKLLNRLRNLDDLQPVIELFFTAKDVDTGLKQVEALLKKVGREDAATWVDNWRIELAQQDLMGDAFKHFASNIAQEGAKAGRDFGTAFVGSLKQVLGQAAGFARKALLADVAGDTPGQLAALRAEVERRQKALDIATAPGSKAGPATIERVAGDLKQAQDALQGLLDQIASDAKSVQQKADDARQKADQATLAAIAAIRAATDIPEAKAQLTAGLDDDIAVQKLISQGLRQSIAFAAKNIKDVALRTQTVRELTVAWLQSVKATKDFIATQKQNVKDAIIAKRDRKEESLNLDVQIAETKKNVGAELKAHQALLRYLIARQKHTDRGSLEWKRLQLKIEQERAAIGELRKSNKARQDELKKAEFEFLQKQTGFVANLLGNLLPIGAVVGTVGGGPGTPTGPRGPTGATSIRSGGPSVPPDVRDAAALARSRGGPSRPPDVQDAARKAAAQPGASHGQMATLIMIARAQLGVFRHLAGQNTHPEASYNHKTDGRAWEGVGA